VAYAVHEADELTPLEREFDSAFRRNFSRYLTPDFMLALRRFLAKATLCRPYSVSVGTTPVQLVAFNPARVRVSIFNNGSATVYYGRSNKVNVGSAGSPDAGFPILANTGEILTDTVAEIWAVSGSAAQDVRIDDVTVEGL
jgi:hypothetical protein